MRLTLSKIQVLIWEAQWKEEATSRKEVLAKKKLVRKKS
jgi:hypothetical protein